MTKEMFDNYNEDLYCLTCKNNVPKIHIDRKKVHHNGEILRCNACEWVKKHPEKMSYKDFTKEELTIFIHFFIFEKSEILNDLSIILNRNIDELVNLFQFMNMGNKKCWIKVNCEFCGKEHLVKPQVYKERKYHYCSTECYYNDKSSKMPKGEDSPFYNRISTNCTNCGKEIKVIPYNFNNINQYGDNHNFCCQECYWEYRSKYYIGDKTYNYQREISDEEKEQHRIVLLNRLQSEDRLNTSIQKKIDDYLIQNDIEFIREKTFDYYAVDNYLVSSNGIVEVMGDYWHTNPFKYNQDKYLINEIQKKQLHRDKIKYSYIKNHYNIPILYLWESDINNRFSLCCDLILQYINNNLVLQNYHSFNWNNNNDKLELNNILVIPYQDLSVNDYRFLLSEKVS